MLGQTPAQPQHLQQNTDVTGGWCWAGALLVRPLYNSPGSSVLTRRWSCSFLSLRNKQILLSEMHSALVERKQRELWCFTWVFWRWHWRFEKIVAICSYCGVRVTDTTPGVKEDHFEDYLEPDLEEDSLDTVSNIPNNIYRHINTVVALLLQQLLFDWHFQLVDKTLLL